MTHKIVRARVAAHDCDTSAMLKSVQRKGLGTGTVARCEPCGQYWYVIHPVHDNWQMKPITAWDRFWLRFGYVTFS